MNRLDQLLEDTRRALSPPVQLRREDLLPNAVGNAAYLSLASLVTGTILGLPVESAGLERNMEWLTDSVARSEVFGDPPEYFAMRQREALALTTWLLTGISRRDVFGDAVGLHERALSRLAGSGPDLARDYLPDLVRDSFSAGRYDHGVDAYTRQLGPPPDDPAGVETPLQLAGWLCREVGGLARPAAWVARGSQVVGDHLLDWLDRGEGLDAGLWLKVVFFDSGAALTPTDALRRGGVLMGALPVDPLAQVLLESLGDPVDLDLFAGFLTAVAAATLRPGSVITAEFSDCPSVSVPVTEAEFTTGLDHAIAAALSDSGTERLTDRLTEAARGRLVDTDGVTPVTLRRIAIS